jgi:PLD-like domain
MSSTEGDQSASFDIDSLLQFSPPQYMCQKCCALNLPLPPSSLTEKPVVCPVCQVKYLPTNEYPTWALKEYLKEEGAALSSLKNPIVHGQALALIARNFRAKDEDYPPICALYACLLQAQQFVHFTTYGISYEFIGALKLAAQRVTIRGVVTNVNADAVRELTEFPSEAPRLRIAVFGSGDRVYDVPHQKLIVVDGLVAFKGSTNLTIPGWRKAQKGLDLLEMVTDVAQVIKLHNEYFSPLWGQHRHSDYGDTIKMHGWDF